jgi:hypothetical protein
VAAVAIDLYGVARAFTRRAAVFAARRRRTAAGWILTDFLVLIVRHLASSSNEFELPFVWRSTLAHSAICLEAIPRREGARAPSEAPRALRIA